MSWWGTLAGGAFGFMVSGPIGALVGAAVGYRLDSSLKNRADDTDELRRGDPARVQTAFFVGTFSVLGYMAKADGVVTDDEIRMAELIMTDMELDAEQRQAAIDLFNQGKHPDFEFDAVMEQLRVELSRRRDLMRAFIEMQLQVALADGAYHAAEQKVIRRISGHLHLGPEELSRIERFVSAWRDARREWGRQRADGADHWGNSGNRSSQDRAAQTPQNKLALAYELLGVAAADNDATVKRAYRRLTSQHHPDKLVAKGLPEEMMKAATEKTQAIREAYETIMAARKT